MDRTNDTKCELGSRSGITSDHSSGEKMEKLSEIDAAGGLVVREPSLPPEGPGF